MALTELPPSPVAPAEARALRSALELPESVYIKYLPVIYQHDPFMRRFMMIFESVLAPLERAVDNLPAYTEPELTPEAFLPWLAHWVAVSLDSAWPLDRQRALINNAVEIYRWRGTARGLKLHIKTYTGFEPLIQEYRGGFVLGQESGLGWTTQLSTGAANTLLFVVTAPVSSTRQADPQVLRAIIEEDKPAHTTYRLRLVRRRGTGRDGLGG